MLKISGLSECGSSHPPALRSHTGRAAAAASLAFFFAAAASSLALLASAATLSANVPSASELGLDKDSAFLLQRPCTLVVDDRGIKPDSRAAKTSRGAAEQNNAQLLLFTSHLCIKLEVRAPARPAGTAKAKKIFDLCDTDGDRSFDRKELVGALGKLGFTVDTKQAFELVEKTGIVGDVGVDAFVKIALLLHMASDSFKKDAKGKGEKKKAAAAGGGKKVAANHVAGWDYNSPHTIAAEYIETHASYVSVL